MESQDKFQPMIVRASGMNFSEILGLIIKYLIEGGAVAVAAFVIPRKKNTWQEIVMIALTATAIFAILDLFAPAVGLAARQGAGFGVGATMVGFPGVPMGSGAVPGIPPM
jgi:hypothetical protein